MRTRRWSYRKPATGGSRRWYTRAVLVPELRCPRKALAALVAGASMLILLACGGSKRPAAVAVQPILLAQLALAPAETGSEYSVLSERYVDDDGNTAPKPTGEFIRQLEVRAADAPEAPPASRITVTLSDQGADDATEFIDAAGDPNVGPPNLEDYVHKQVPESQDVHVSLLDDFPSVGDDSVANKLIWQTESNGEQITWDSYAVYIRTGGLLALVAARAQDTGHGEPEGLRKQAETLAKKQADKMHSGRDTPVVSAR